jgi:hypothetical protein
MKAVLYSATFFALLAGPACADDTPVVPKKVKFDTLKTQHIVVEVKVNGKGPYRLIFDTGAPAMLIDNHVAKDAGVIDKNTKRPAFAPFGMMGTPMKMKTFELGDLKAEDVDAIVMEHPTVSAISQMFGPIHGIVGFPFFARYRTTVDYQAKEMSFVPNGFKPTDIFQSLMAKLTGNREEGPTILAPAGQWGFSADKGMGDDAAGLDVKEVLANSPAAKAGLKSGDRLLTLDSRWTDSLVDLFDAASAIKPGSTVPLKIKRGDKEIELKVTPKAGL